MSESRLGALQKRKDKTGAMVILLRHCKTNAGEKSARSGLPSGPTKVCCDDFMISKWQSVTFII